MKDMKTIELEGHGKIVIDRRTEIYVPHLDEVLAFTLLMTGPNHFKKVMGAIDKDGGLRPTTAQTLSLVDLVLQNPDEEHCRYILSRFMRGYLLTSTENLFGKTDVIIYDYDDVDGTMPRDRAGLVKRHKDGDKAVRIVPYGFRTGRQSTDEFLKNPWVIAQIKDKEMLEIVRKVAEKVSEIRGAKTPSEKESGVWALNPTKNDVETYSVLGSGWGGGRGLSLIGSFCYNDSAYKEGYASRVQNVSPETVVKPSS